MARPVADNTAAATSLDGRGHCYPLAHSSPFPTALVAGAEHVVHYVNPAFCRLVGKLEDDLLGTRLAESLPQCKGCLDLVAKASQAGAANSYIDYEASGVLHVPWTFSVWPAAAEDGSSPGTMIQVTEASELQSQSIAMNQALMLNAVRHHEIEEESEILTLGMSFEIERRKKSEESLTVTEARLRLALESAKASTWEWNIQNNTLRWSDESPTLAGLEVPSRVESFELWRSLVHPEDREAVDSVAEQAANSRAQIGAEFRILDAAGTTHWMLLRGCLGRVEDGRTITYTGILLDVTERKHAEQALLRSEKLAGVGRLAATLAHEINNPLDAAMNALYLAQTDPEIPDSARKYLAMADEELRRVAHMTRQSLGFYREATLPASFAVDTLLDSVLGLMKNRIAAKSITVENHPAENLLITGVFGELRQVFVNLLANSLDALNPDGHIKLRTSTHRSQDGTSVIRITVADTGKGIPAPQLTRVFEPFFTTKGELGTGLGLWVTKQIVEKHGGSIRVRSSTNAPHNGTVFSVSLPSNQ